MHRYLFVDIKETTETLKVPTIVEIEWHTMD
jgi:hypothetical protein